MTKTITEELSSIFGQPVGNVKFTLEVQSSYNGYQPTGAPMEGWYSHGVQMVHLEFTCMRAIPEAYIDAAINGIIFMKSERDLYTKEYAYTCILVRGKNTAKIADSVASGLSINE